MKNNIQISKNFNMREFECKDGHGAVMIDSIMLSKLQALRDLANKPVNINSAYRTPEYNKKVGGSPNSRHMEGRAVDVRIKGLTPKQVAVLGEKVGFTGIGTYATFTHLDTRMPPARWNG